MGTIGQREINSEILQGYYWLSCSCKGHIRNQNGGNSFSPKGDLTAPETSTSYKNHGDNKLGFICAHQPEMASMKPSQHWCSFRSTLLTRSISPGHRKHKQHLRFQQLQQTKRRAVKFWSLLGFCAKSNFVLWGWVYVDYCYYQIPHRSPNTWIWAFIYCLILLFDFSQLHFSLSPNPRKEIIIFPETLKYLWVRENTAFTTTVLKPRICEVLYEFKVCSTEKSQTALKLEMASVGKMWENTHADMLHILHPQFHTILIHGHLGKGNKLGFTASCGLCLIFWHSWWWPDV